MTKRAIAVALVTALLGAGCIEDVTLGSRDLGGIRDPRDVGAADLGARDAGPDDDDADEGPDDDADESPDS